MTATSRVLRCYSLSCTFKIIYSDLTSFMATGPLAPPIDHNRPTWDRGLSPNGVFRHECHGKGIGKAETLEKWKAMSHSERKKYNAKSKKYRAEYKAILRKYRETEQYQQFLDKMNEWENKIAEYYPPKPTKEEFGHEKWQHHRIWYSNCKAILRTCKKTGTLEGTEWMRKYQERNGITVESTEQKVEQNIERVQKMKMDTIKNSNETGVKVGQDDLKQLKVITKAVKKSNVKTDEKDKRKVKVNQNKLAAIKKKVKNVKAKKGTKDKKKGARKLNQNKKGKQLEKKLKKKQEKKKKGKNQSAKSGVKKKSYSVPDSNPFF